MILQYNSPLPVSLPSCKYNIHLECTDKNNNEWSHVTNGNIKVKTCEYLNTDGNYHHYTNSFLFNVMFPIILKLFDISYELNDYSLCKYETPYDYHIPKKDEMVNVFSCTGTRLYGYSSEILRDRKKIYLNECPGTKTTYHTLYTFSHRCSTIFNVNNSTSRILLLNSDSMIIPLIPLLALKYKVVIVMDNRTPNSYNFLYKTLQPKITDYLCILQSPNITKHKEILNLK